MYGYPNEERMPIETKRWDAREQLTVDQAFFSG
jgi:hypothetical protein